MQSESSDGVWDVKENAWQEQFERLKKFEKKNGHANVPKANVLYDFIYRQRLDYRHFVRDGKGPFVKQNHRIKLLKDIGVDLDPRGLL